MRSGGDRPTRGGSRDTLKLPSGSGHEGECFVMFRVKCQHLLSAVFDGLPVALVYGLVGLIEETVDSPLDPVAGHG